MRILVTGGSGFIGSHLITALLDRGDEVINMDIRGMTWGGTGLTDIDGDIQLSAAWGQLDILTPVDMIIHLAARPGVRSSILDPFSCEGVNIYGTLKMLEYMKDNNIKKLVFASSSSVYGDSISSISRESDRTDRTLSPYAASKGAGELLCHAYSQLHDISVAALRFFTVYGSRQRPDMGMAKFINNISKGLPIQVYGDPYVSSRDYTHVSDAVRGIVLAADRLKSGFNAYNICSGEAHTLEYVINKIRELVDKVPIIEHLPRQPGDVLRTRGSGMKADINLGFESRTTLHDGLVEQIGGSR